MNGKRWPWEAVTLLPFIDSTKLIESVQSSIDDRKMTQEEKQLNEFGVTHVLTRSLEHDDDVKEEPLNDSKWAKLENDANVTFQPQLNPGTHKLYFPTLLNAPIKKLNRRKVFLNVFGLKSRYRTALIEMHDKLPIFPPTSLLAKNFIGTTVNFNYPILQEGLVCSVSDSTTVYRGNAKPKKWSKEAQMKRSALLSKMFKELQTGEGRTGTGGWILPKTDITLTVRPLESIKTLRDGTKAKVYAKRELEMPFVAALFSPSKRDPRLEIPARLEKNPFIFGGQSQLNKYTAQNSASIGKSFNKQVLGLVGKHIQSHSDGAQKVSAGKFMQFLRGNLSALIHLNSVRPS